MVYGFCTFRSMEGAKLMIKAYERYPRASTRCVAKFFGHIGICCVKDRERIKLREIDGQWPYPKKAILPDNIQWQNMGFSNTSRMGRSLCVNFLALIVLFLAFAGIFFFNHVTDLLDDKFTISDVCDFNSITKK
mgnify:FL=1|jgi:hypothetical protein